MILRFINIVLLDSSLYCTHTMCSVIELVERSSLRESNTKMLTVLVIDWALSLSSWVCAMAWGIMYIVLCYYSITPVIWHNIQSSYRKDRLLADDTDVHNGEFQKTLNIFGWGPLPIPELPITCVRLGFAWLNWKLEEYAFLTCTRERKSRPLLVEMLAQWFDG